RRSSDLSQHGDRRPAQHRRPRGGGGTGVPGVPVRPAAVAGLLPRADGAAGPGRAAGRGPAPRGRPGDRAPAGHGGPATALLDSHAGDLAAAVALPAAPAQAGDAHAGAPALRRRVRLPGAAPERFGRARRGRGVLARGAGGSGPGDRRASARRGRRGRGAAQAPASQAAAGQRRMSTPVVAVVGLGGNVGDTVRILRQAFDALAAVPGTRMLATSALYRTPAWGVEDQADFINAAAALETELEATVLLEHLLAIERRFGRVRAADGSDRWGPRTLDLDLLLYGAHVIDEPGLRV